jgi:hypothetical protein
MSKYSGRLTAHTYRTLFWAQNRVGDGLATTHRQRRLGYLCERRQCQLRLKNLLIIVFPTL